MDDSTTKRCYTCRIDKPLAQFNKRQKSPDGRATHCKDCIRDYQRAYYAGLVAARVERALPIEKTCCRCEQTKPADVFDRTVQSPDGLTSHCQDCRRARRIELAHGSARERVRKENREYYQRHKQRLVPRNRAYQQAHREEINKHARQWRKRNPDKVRLFRRMRHAREKNAPGAYTNAEWQALCDWFGNVCLKCGASGALTVDHVLPMVRGGSNAIDNLQPLCITCNKRKHAKHIDYRDPDRLAAFLTSLR